MQITELGLEKFGATSNVSNSIKQHLLDLPTSEQHVIELLNKYESGWKSIIIIICLHSFLLLENQEKHRLLATY